LEETNHFKSYRLISRDEDPLHHIKRMQYVMPNRTDTMVILDDRRDVWDHSPHCVVTKPYFYFFRSSQNKLEAFQWENGGGTLEIKSSMKDPPK
jgi:TFIIF-interacting CTD phosphatase-like protein